MSPTIQVIPLNSDTATLSIQIQNAQTKTPIPAWQFLTPPRWSCTDPRVTLEEDPTFKFSRRAVCGPHDGPLIVTVTVEGDVDLMDGQPLRPLKTQTVLQFNKSSPLVEMILSVKEDPA